MGAHQFVGVALRSQNPLTIATVDENSPASRAGLKAGDVVTEFDGKSVKKYADLVTIIAAKHVHDRVPIRIVRNGAPPSKTIEIGERTE